jgi:5'-nucleotidase
VVSGINAGANLGDDVTYSGTVAGAYEGMLLGIPAMAISDVRQDACHMETAAKFSRKLAGHILEHGLPPETMLNVNVPDVPYEAIAGVAITRMGRRDYKDEIIKRHDPRGMVYYWIGGNEPSHIAEPDTDFEAVGKGLISVTPLQRDMTSYSALRILAGRGLMM